MESGGGLSDEGWERLRHLLPSDPPRGGRWRDHRSVIDAVAWKVRGNNAWRDLPEWFGPCQTVFGRFRRWARDGTWERILTELQAQADAVGDIDWLVGVDSTTVRARQHAAGARKKGAPAGESADHALGRSRGGLTTKVHLAPDGRCRPLSLVVAALVVAAGHRHDPLFFEAVVNGIRVPRIGPGRPRTRPERVSADRAYSSRAIRAHLRERGVTAVIPQPADQVANRKRRGSRGGRPPAYDRQAYKHRNTVERCVNRLKQWRGIAVRTEKPAVHYLAALRVPAIFLWLKP
ncbi:IS5 family transposase [Kitasatospora sp. NPDC059646]|uniref:IS5 family transposase n=1 Tax=Kitasatospora sp. NPDC059646 TaxID=3346893 RepID=UPI00368AF45B